uniref:Uncharacterized protein n=1 Tax=Oryza punctata TaxID=4537 RepID=A0A0E0JQS8_ORYPU
MSIPGEVPGGEGSDGEEVFINEEDIINEIPIDEEALLLSAFLCSLTRSASASSTGGTIEDG